MTKYFGVKCKSCEDSIPLARVTPDNSGEVTIYLVPLEPVPCRACGSSFLYDKTDEIRFEGKDDMLNQPRAR